jgi:hypothetical protein
MKLHTSKKGAVVASWIATLAVCAIVGLAAAQGAKDAQGAKEAKPAAAPKYIGADKCKNCHQVEEAGNQYAHWAATGHAKAWEVLASDDAKKIGKEKGIEDPQKSEKCLKCHVTAFGLDDQIKKGFDPKLGVQCETCHGPGEAHMKARMAAAATADPAKKGQRMTIAADEIKSNPEAATCTKCHNSESPTFKPFCIHQRAAKIRHLDPRKNHDAMTLICGCSGKDGCTHKCDDKCGGTPSK